MKKYHTNIHRKKIREKVVPETFNSRKLRFVARTVNPYWLIDLITVIGLQYPQKSRVLGELTIFYCLSGQQTNLFTVQATIFHQKEISVDNEVKFQLHTILQIRCDLEQTTPRVALKPISI